MLRRLIATSWLLAGWVASAGAATPTTCDVFKGGDDGYHTYRIPSVVLATNGTLLAFCEGRHDNGRDAGRIDLVLKRSTDRGQTWSGLQVVWSDDGNTCGNPTPVVDRTTGVIWLLMTWNLGSDLERDIEAGKSRDTRRVFVCSSSDNGDSWSKPKEITHEVKPEDWHWYATGPVNGIQLMRGEHAGRLVIPANHSVLSTNSHPATLSHVIYSDDHGATWKVGGVEEEKTNESTVAERADGSLLQNMRSNHGQHRRAVATSKDGGLTWSPVRLDPALVEPVCQGCLLRATWAGPGSKSRLLFSNPASTKRERLTVRVSYDEGETWPVSQTLFDGSAAYSDLVMLDGSTVGCLFECGENNPYERIEFARFPLSWLEGNRK